MSTYFVGFEVKKGQFTNDNGGIVDYSNRLLNCITDDGQNDKNFGFTGFQVKLKMSEVAFSLGVPERDDAVDAALKNIFKKRIEFSYAPKNGTMMPVGFHPDFSK